jgi:hypothetical protein
MHTEARLAKTPILSLATYVTSGKQLSYFLPQFLPHRVVMRFVAICTLF